MSDFPRSLLEFQRRFPDAAACAAYLAAVRWPEGFVCPACGGRRAVITHPPEICDQAPIVFRIA